MTQDAKTPLFRVINKARGIISKEQIDADTRSIADLGLIPFDMDVLNSFGSNDFWEQVSRSLYRWALARAWNRLSSKLQLGVDLQLPRLSPVASERAEARIGMLGLKERVLFLYGLIIAAFGICYGLLGPEILSLFKEDPTRFVSLTMGFAGLAMAIFALFHKR